MSDRQPSSFIISPVWSAMPTGPVKAVGRRRGAAAAAADPGLDLVLGQDHRVDQRRAEPFGNASHGGYETHSVNG